MSNKSSSFKLRQIYLIRSFSYLLDPKHNRAAHSPENGGESAKGNSLGALVTSRHKGHSLMCTILPSFLSLSFVWQRTR